MPNINSVESALIPENERTVNTPLPPGIEVPSNEKPSTVVPPAEMLMPASPAAPPLPPVKSKPVTSN